MNVMERKNTELIREFNTYIREHPQFADDIPNESIVIMQPSVSMKVRHLPLEKLVPNLRILSEFIH